jgi:hypothetical protein
MSEKASEEVRPVTGMSRSTAVFFSTEPKTEPKPRLVMKPITSFALLAAIAATIGAANAAATDPVGYITHTVNANATAPTLTLIAPSLVQPDVFAGASTASPSGGTTITFASGVPTNLGAGHVLEVTASGWWSTVVSSTATTITVSDAFPAGLPANTAVGVRPHTTLDSFLGANAPGLNAIGGAGTNDEVQILNSSLPGQPLSAYAYVLTAAGVPQDGWYNLADSSPAGSTVIEPGTGIIIKTNKTANFTFTSSGEVKTTPTQYDVFTGLNVIGSYQAAGTTFNGTNLQNSLNQLTGSNGDYDELQVLTASQAINAYAALAPGVAGPQATVGSLADSSDAGALPFNEGTGALVKRVIAPSTITLPPALVTP